MGDTARAYPERRIAGESTRILQWMIVEGCSTFPLFPQARVGEV